MQITEVRPRHDHAVQQLLHLVGRLAFNISDLAFIPKPLCRLHQKQAQRSGIAPAQNSAQLRGVGRLTRLFIQVPPERFELPTPALGRRRSFH
jgi:hypothetical protein